MVVASLLCSSPSATSIAAVNQLAPNTIGALQLKSGSVGSSEVKNRNLLAVDFKQDSSRAGARGLRGLQGPPGQQGAQGPAGAAGVAAPGYVAQVTSQTGATAASTSSTSYVNLAGAAETIRRARR